MFDSCVLLVATTMILLSDGGGLPSAHAGEGNGSYPPAISLPQLRRQIDACVAPHPRLLASREDLATIRRSIQGDPLSRSIAEVVVQQATMMRDEQPVSRMLSGIDSLRMGS